MTDIIALWPSVPDFANDIGVKPKHAQTMKDRDSIPDPYWLKVVAAASVRGLENVTLEHLAEIAAARRQPATAEAAE